MIRKLLFFILLLACSPLLVWAQNWDAVQTSGDYYFGVGRGQTEVEADKAAMEALVSQIATNVSNDFIQIDDERTVNGTTEHKQRVLNCMKTYSQATLTNCERWVVGKEPDVTVRRYIKRSELQRIYESRIDKAKGMVEIAKECLEERKIDMALQYYYWAYSLIRSVQYPNEVKDKDGRILTDILPLRIRDILRNIRVEFIDRVDDRVNLSFLYDGKPVSSLEFFYNDGRSDNCEARANDGRGMIEMAPGVEKEAYHLHLNYEYIEQARGDAEMESVLNVITKKVIPEAGFRVEDKSGRNPKVSDLTPSLPPTTKLEKDLGVNLKPSKSQVISELADYDDIMRQVIEASRTRNLSNVDRYFTINGGLPRYRTLLKMGVARVVGTPKIEYFKGQDGRVVARGMQMSLTYNSRGRKKTFVEDVVFTFNTDKRIENVTFGLGQTATNDILCKHPKWNNETKELLMEFLENYKTAYCMKDSAYIRQIFADDAVIIIGNVARKAPASNAEGGSINREHAVSVQGQQVIRYNRYTKDEYLRNLRRCFGRNEFINLRFSNNEIQRLEKFKDKELFGIQIGQEYSSSTYSDIGYLFLLTDLTDHNLPQIKVRTWQPNEVEMEKLYHAGYFYDN